MRRAALVCVFGLAAGFVGTARHRAADACSCRPLGSRLKLVEVSSGVHGSAWDFHDTFFMQTGDEFEINAFGEFVLRLREAE